MPLEWPSALRPQRRRKRQPLRPQQQAPLRSHDPVSHPRPLNGPGQRLLPVLRLRPVLVPQQPPFRLQHRRSSRHPHRAPQRHPPPALQRRSHQPPFQANQQQPLRPAHRPPVPHLPGSSTRHSAQLRLLALLSAGRARNRGLPCRSCSADDRRSNDGRKKSSDTTARKRSPHERRMPGSCVSRRKCVRGLLAP